uniref:3FTx n=1 Tax=Micrurus corallinus TaxID=54390 RepID=C6JUP4_MICCO|nr:3FTx precursor [Micrurus corallinus]
MKTLLLTLVVVTIMCLDLGYTRKCRIGKDGFYSVTCTEKENLCFTMFSARSPTQIIERGCASSCSSRYMKCCSTDSCNG